MAEPHGEFSFIFEPDLAVASDLMNRSWARPCWNWNVDLLNLHIKRPSGDPSCAGGYGLPSGELISYAAYIPFHIEYCHKVFDIGYGTFFTVAQNYRGTGVAQSTQSKLIERLIQKNYDLLIVLTEAGAASNGAFAKVFQQMDLDFKIIRTFNYLAATLSLIRNALPPNLSGKTRLFEESDGEDAYRILHGLGKNTPLRKIVPRADIDFVLRTRPLARTYVFEKDGIVKGLTNVLLLEVLDSDMMKNAYFENLAIDRLSADEQYTFIGDIFHHLQSEDISAAFLPDIGYADLQAFRKFFFRLAPRQLHLYVASLKKTIFIDGIPEVESFYLDIF